MLTLGIDASALQPTKAQIDQFKSLSLSEQKALAESFGIDIPAGLGGAQGGSRVGSPKQLNHATQTMTPTPKRPEKQQPHSTTGQKMTK